MHAYRREIYYEETECVNHAKNAMQCRPKIYAERDRISIVFVIFLCLQLTEQAAIKRPCIR